MQKRNVPKCFLVGCSLILSIVMWSCGDGTNPGDSDNAGSTTGGSAPGPRPSPTASSQASPSPTPTATASASPEPSPTASASASPPVCTEQFVYGLSLRIENQDGQVIRNATAEISDGTDYLEEMQRIGSGNDTVYIGAGERPGTYRLMVSAPGHESTTVEGIVIDKDECHVIPVRRTVPMQQR